MNTYEIKLRNYEQPLKAFGKTPQKAKYQAYMEHADLFDGFHNFLAWVESVHLVSEFRVSDLFSTDKEGFARTCEYRGIPFARIGMRVAVNGKTGTICGVNNSSNLNICFDGECFVTNCHPGYKMEFLT